MRRSFRARRTSVGVWILGVWLFTTISVELLSPRLTPPGGLTGRDYLLIALMPVGSFIAGRYCQGHTLHFSYGALGSLCFVVAGTSGGRYAFSLWQPAERNLVMSTLGWCVFCIAMGFVCRAAASVFRLPTNRAGFCIACGYDLTGNVSGVCPECGEAITSEHQQARTDGTS